MASRENNTMAEGLSKIMKDLSQMKLEPDADMPFLISLETDILNYLKPPVPQQPGTPPQGSLPQQQQGPPQGPMAGAMGQVMGSPMAGGPAPGPMGAGVSTVGMGMPNPDEFRRGLGNAAIRGASRQLVHRMMNLTPPTM